VSAFLAKEENQIRLLVYHHFVERGQAPTVAQIADTLRCDEAEVVDILRRLAEKQVLVLGADNASIFMAMPFSAVPTDFVVTSSVQGWWAN
jgi:hypothetical protein